MAIGEREVRHLAHLARLALGDDEIARMATELDVIIAYIDELRALDTAGVEPIAHVTGLVNVARPDEPRTMLPSKAVLANAPQADDIAFLVPKAVER